MFEQARISTASHEVVSALHALGVSEDTIRQAVARGLGERQNATPFDPPSYPGYAQWARTIRALRELLVPQGWEADDTGGFSTVVSPDGRLAIAVATGDDRTARTGFPPPATKYPRGPMTHAAIKVNVQLSLFDPPAEVDDESPAPRVTWILLISTRHEEVRMEMSCPQAIGEDGRVASWSQRIILGSLEIEPTLERADEDEPGLPDIDVPVERIL